jgi:hypothetical protein
MPELQADRPRTLKTFRERPPENLGVHRRRAEGDGAALEGPHADQEQRRPSARQCSRSERLPRVRRRRDRRGARVVLDPGHHRDLHSARLLDAAARSARGRRGDPLPSNQNDDIGRKLSRYLEIPSLRYYLVIRQDRRQIVPHQRWGDLGGVFLTNIAPPDPLRLEPPGIDVPHAAIYAGVPLE